MQIGTSGLRGKGTKRQLWRSKLHDVEIGHENPFGEIISSEFSPNLALQAHLR